MVFERVKELLAEQMDIDKNNITLSTRIIEDTGADSLDVVEMLMTVEAEWGIIVDDDDMAGFKTVGDVVNYIEAKTK